MLVDKMTYKNRKCIVKYIWSGKVEDGLQDKLHNLYLKKKSEQYIPQKQNKNRHSAQRRLSYFGYSRRHGIEHPTLLFQRNLRMQR